MLRIEAISLKVDEVIIGNAPQIAISFCMALIIALSARISFMIPVSAVPVTMQTAAVLAAGVFLGPRWGTMSVIWYLALGLMGAPVFAMGISGPGVVMQPSFGYLLAFPVAAWMVGTLMRNFGTGFAKVFVFGVLALGVIYAAGAFWLTAYFVVSGKPFQEVLRMALISGTVPFVLMDLMKIVLVALISLAVPSRWRIT